MIECETFTFAIHVLNTEVKMPSALYEIAELPNGDVVLRKVDDQGEPLVALHFSAESLAFMGEGKFEVAKAMIEAGMEAASELLDDNVAPEDFSEYEKQMLH
jgi:hypothetical protein